jgi:hypothetical protein
LTFEVLLRCFESDFELARPFFELTDDVIPASDFEVVRVESISEGSVLDSSRCEVLGDLARRRESVVVFWLHKRRPVV